MASQLKPRVRRTAQNTQITYNLKKRIHDVKTYPALSPQGSSILIYGHSNGVTVVWRGGPRLKPAKCPQPESISTTQQNGDGSDAATTEDAVMIIDSSDTDASSSLHEPFVERAEFENDNVDDSAGYPDIIQTLDLAIGIDVLYVAVPPFVPQHAGDSSGNADILAMNMFFSVACANGYTYMMTLPLTPPSHDSKLRNELREDLLIGFAGRGKWQETLVSLGCQCKCPDGIAMSFAPRRTNVWDDSEWPPNLGTPWRAIVAVHGKDASGTLRLWDVPLRASSNEPAIEPFRTEYLPSPLTGTAFNPLHPTQLLAVASPHAVRVYDYSRPSKPHDEASERIWPAHGPWLLSLHLPFVRGVSATGLRKPIIGAQWISHGRAILALFADGQWGIWDIEGAGPLGNEGPSSLFSKQNSCLRGTALTAFTTSGYLEGTSPLRNPSAQKARLATNDVDLAAGCHREPLRLMNAGPERLAAVKGGVEVTLLPSSRGAESFEESAVLWLAGSDYIVCVIPVVAQFWDAQARRRAGGGVKLFSGAQPSRMARLVELNAGLLDERCCGVGLVPRLQRRQSPDSNLDPDTDVEESTGLPVDVIICGESRLVVVQDYRDVETAPLRHHANTKQVTHLVPANGPVEPVNAIVVHRNPDQSANQPHGFDLSIRGGRENGRSAVVVKPFGGSLNQSQDGLVADPDDSPSNHVVLPTRPDNMGFAFMDDLDAAADAGYELDAEERDIEQEIMDLMEMDDHIEQMEDERIRGATRVFFEQG